MAPRSFLPLLLFLPVSCWPGGKEDASENKVAPFMLPTLRIVLPDASLASHGKLGEAMGTRFADGVRKRLAEWGDLQQRLLPALSTEKGKKLYEGFLRTHMESFPEYIAELRGIAKGSGVPFEQLFVAQVEQEFSALLSNSGTGNHTFAASKLAADHCSDYMLCSPRVCVDVHNEDNNANSINRTFILDAQLGGSDARFLAFVYMGELPSGAFGVNARGIGFSLNWVGPPAASRPGLGRGFVSRSLLDAHDRADALKRATIKGQAGGHNIQVFDFCGRKIVNVETAQDRFAFRSIGDEPFFHANQYQTLDVPGQTLANSSLHRLARVQQLPLPKTLKQILNVLGDQGDTLYPIFHDKLSHARGELSDWTLATVSFDLDKKAATILQGNPKDDQPRTIWDISVLIAHGGGCPHGETLIMM